MKTALKKVLLFGAVALLLLVCAAITHLSALLLEAAFPLTRP